jgi:integrase
MERHLKLPRYVHGFIDRHGRARFYLRRAGFPKVALPGLPYSPDFMAAYEAGMAKAPEVAVRGKIVPMSMRALAVSFYSSAEFKGLKAITQRRHRAAIDKFCLTVSEKGVAYGDKRAAALNAEQLKKLMAAKAETPDAANLLRKVMRALMKHAVALKWRADDPTQAVKALKPKSKLGFHRWTDAEIAQFEHYHPIGTKARKALALGLYTGQAREDAIQMGEQHIADGVLHWTRRKTATTTGIELAIPVHPTLRHILDETPSGHLTFLVTEFAKPFTAAGFGNWFKEQCYAANLPHCSFHGLRKAAASRLAEAGASVHEIAAITGHATLKEIARYTATADRKRLARSAVAKMK